jgi:phosphoglycolate phosphatase-like HAD superfamily hydrolase
VTVTVAVFDIDGVVADVRHRLHLIEGRRRDWVRFHQSAVDDPALVEGITLVKDLGAHHEIAWLSGRPEWLRSVTGDWLAKHGLPDAEIHLRGNSDRRPARLFKLAVLRRLSARSIAAFVDDDTEVVQAAIAAGYPAILADWVPRASSLREAQDWLGRA